jgi:hypothetical protein
VVVACGVFDGATVSFDAGKREIHGRILRSSLPESKQIRFSLVEAAGVVAIAQGSGQAKLVLGVRGIASEGGTESIDGFVVMARSGGDDSLLVEPTAAGLLIEVITGYQMAHGGEAGGGGKSEY